MRARDRLLLRLVAPILVLGACVPLLLRRETLSDLRQRFGLDIAAPPGALWVHGASVGELTAARALITSLAAEAPLLVTANKVTGRALVRSWALDKVTAGLAPLDLTSVLAKALGQVQPRALILLENELWPTRITTVSAPVLCVSARMSRTSASRWRRFAPHLIRDVLARVTYLAPQDPASAERFVTLGLPNAALGPVYAPKADPDVPAPDPSALAALRPHFPRDTTLLAASTHPGEEAILFDALRQMPRELRLILAPRHPHRGPALAALAKQQGVTVALRSRGDRPDAQVYIADTLGEMALWYSLAAITFVGGSLVDKGGHTPFEPIQFGSALITGPYRSNFEAIYADLQAGKALQHVADAASIAAAWQRLQHPGAALAAADSALLIAARHVDRFAATADVIRDIRAILAQTEPSQRMARTLPDR